MSWLSRITGRQYHFKITLKFYPNVSRSENHVSRTCNIWFEDRSMAANDRAIRKAIGEEMVRQIPPTQRKNGKLQVVEASYLGWFRPIGNHKKAGNK